MNYLPHEYFVCPTDRDLELQTENTCVTRISWVMARWLLGMFFVIYFIAFLLLPTNTVMQWKSQGQPTTLVSFGIAPNVFGFDHWKAVYVNAS